MSDLVIVAYNDSPSAKRALGEALRRAALSADCEVLVVAVNKREPNRSGKQHQACEEWLQAACRFADERCGRIRTEIRAGHPVTELLQAVLEHRADVLIVGCSGWGAQPGSTVDRILRHAPCPVLVVH